MQGRDNIAYVRLGDGVNYLIDSVNDLMIRIREVII